MTIAERCYSCSGIPQCGGGEQVDGGLRFADPRYARGCLSCRRPFADRLRKVIDQRVTSMDGDAVLPSMPRLAGEMIDRPRRQLCRRPIETAGPATPEPQRRRRSERDAEDMLEHRPVSVPANPGTRVVADQQGLDEFARAQAGRTAPPSHEAATANQGSPRPGRSWHRRNRSASHRRRSAVYPAIHGSGRARVPPRRSTRSTSAPRPA